MPNCFKDPSASLDCTLRQFQKVSKDEGVEDDDDDAMGEGEPAADEAVPEDEEPKVEAEEDEKAPEEVGQKSG